MKLINILDVNLIKYPLQNSGKTNVIKELVMVLAEHHRIQNPDDVLKAVLERENIMTTGVGNGVAIPHCKINSREDFAIALGIHPAGVDFQSPDKKPSHIIFLLIGPENKPGIHIRLLSRISRIISQKEVRDRILNSNSAAEVYQALQIEEENFFEINM